MEIFYKKKLLSEQPEVLKKIESSGAELALLLYDKTYGVLEETQVAQLDVVVKGENKRLYYFRSKGAVYTPIGVYSRINAYVKRVTGGEEPYSLESKHLDLQEIRKLRDYTNSDTQNLVNEIYKDFFVVKKEVVALDKYGDKYDIKIVSNADMSIGDDLIVDELFLYKEGKKIGYLKAKYTTPKLKKQHNLNQDKLFLNKATIDYSKLEDEHLNRGLGYVMYFHMAQYLTSQKIDFRMSTLVSDPAQRLWKGIERHWQESVINRKLRNPRKYEPKKFVVYKFLNILEDNILIFENSKPKILKK